MSLNTDAIPSASKSTAQAFPVAPHGSDPGTAQSRPRTLSSAISLLQEIRPRIMEILGQERLRVSLRCMDIMKPERQDLERAHVMWVGPSHDGEDAKQLKKVSEFVNRTFKSAGFVVDEGRSLKLHCTVLNTTYRKPRSKGRQPFSYASILASEALRTVNTMSTSSTETVNLQRRRPMAVDFGEWDIDEVQICEMGSWGPEGEYVCVGRCPLI
ncbi:hypothetical protein AcW1_007127 [Taiwanofungus camphoratus]|nr:hypothetical protein AcV5_008170 [Antrodia cinnamomea]KAI0952720.1 hypothetical protein AcW1_007127 [Antrodia cinnamomea]